MHWSSVQTLSRREVIFRHGDPGTTVILVLEGYVKLFTLTEGREVVLDIVGPGTCLGKVSVLNKWPRSANATTLSPCRLMSIDGRQFRQAIEHRPEGLMAIMRMVSEGLQRRTERMVDTVALSAPARLAKTLLQLARLQSSSLHQANNVPLHLSQSELGSLTSLTRESVNKHLSTWRDAGWILLTGGSVMLRDVPALSRLLLDTSAPGMRAET
jgi:CRP-like cAMP-binding protein